MTVACATKRTTAKSASLAESILKETVQMTKHNTSHEIIRQIRQDESCHFAMIPTYSNLFQPQISKPVSRLRLLQADWDTQDTRHSAPAAQ